MRIFGSRFVDELKKVGERLKRDIRRVTQNYADEGAFTISTKAPTVHRFSQRMFLCLAEFTPAMEVYTKDVTQT